ncbi:hypothetical protein E2562_016036, partial [Oryza meyeriana var. granulata]
QAITARAPLGLCTLCTRDQAYWLTKVPLVFDIFVEPHCPQRVMRQFGLRQVFPMPIQVVVPRDVHRYNRRGQAAGAQWYPRLQRYVEDWLLATEDVVDEFRAHTEEHYLAYLRWYQPRTRIRVTFTPGDPQPHVAATTDTYPTHRDQDYFRAADAARQIQGDVNAAFGRLDTGIVLTADEQRTTFGRI